MDQRRIAQTACIGGTGCSLRMLTLVGNGQSPEFETSIPRGHTDIGHARAATH